MFTKTKLLTKKPKGGWKDDSKCEWEMICTDKKIILKEGTYSQFKTFKKNVFNGNMAGLKDDFNEFSKSLKGKVAIAGTATAVVGTLGYGIYKIIKK